MDLFSGFGFLGFFWFTLLTLFAGFSLFTLRFFLVSFIFSFYFTFVGRFGTFFRYFSIKVLFGFFAAIGALGLIGVVINDSIIMLTKLDREFGVPAREMVNEQIASIAQTRLKAGWPARGRVSCFETKHANIIGTYLHGFLMK